jgi:hypothetical protein
MTRDGRRFVLSRMFDCADLDSLRAVWDTIADEYKRDLIVMEAKEALKKALAEKLPNSQP